jgi:hypothetical protein
LTSCPGRERDFRRDNFRAVQPPSAVGRLQVCSRKKIGAESDSLNADEFAAVLPQLAGIFNHLPAFFVNVADALHHVLSRV